MGVRRTIAAALCMLAPVGAAAAEAEALPPLAKNGAVVAGLYQIGLADEVRKNCDEIAPRLIRALRYARALERYALEAGYSAADVEGLLDDDAAEERLRARIRRDLAARGAPPGDAAGHCAVGREEIAKGSRAGKLLRDKR